MNLSDRTILSYFRGQDNFIFKIVLLDRFDCTVTWVIYDYTLSNSFMVLKKRLKFRPALKYAVLHVFAYCSESNWVQNQARGFYQTIYIYMEICTKIYARPAWLDLWLTLDFLIDWSFYHFPKAIWFWSFLALYFNIPPHRSDTAWVNQI